MDDIFNAIRLIEKYLPKPTYTLKKIKSLTSKDLINDRFTLKDDIPPYNQSAMDGIGVISKKEKTARIAVAESLIKIDKTLYQLLLNDQNLFSNLCATAKIAGVLAAKNTSIQIPLTHQVPIDHITIEFKLLDNKFLKIISSVKSKYTTGLEIEALSAVSTSSITVFDMLKSYKKEIIIQNIQIIKKRGGKNNVG